MSKSSAAGTAPWPARHSAIRTNEVYFVRQEEDAEVTARRIQIRLTGRKGP